MAEARVSSYIPCDGSTEAFDLLTGRKTKTGGDLLVTLVRNPVDIVRGKPFDWTVTLSVANGGLIEIRDIYPNEAPAEGYQPTITINMPANMPKWMASLKRSFYFKSRGGQHYGRMSVKITANYQPPPTYFGANVYLNPAGSRNLEYAPAKRIMISNPD